MKDIISNEPNHFDYHQWLNHEKWLKKRERILKMDGNCCVNCKSNKSLQVHHRQYIFDKQMGVFRKPWEYDDLNLITLCEDCHKRGHELYKIPTFNI